MPPGRLHLSPPRPPASPGGRPEDRQKPIGTHSWLRVPNKTVVWILNTYENYMDFHNSFSKYFMFLVMLWLTYLFQKNSQLLYTGKACMETQSKTRIAFLICTPGLLSVSIDRTKRPICCMPRSIECPWVLDPWKEFCHLFGARFLLSGSGPMA